MLQRTRKEIKETIKRKAYEDFIMSFMPTSDSFYISNDTKLEQSEESLSIITSFMSTERDLNRALFIIQTIIELRTFNIMKQYC